MAAAQINTAAPMQVIATAGHVDHGKSALLRALTAMEPDRWVEEQQRGLTIDLGFVWTDVADGADGENPLTVAFVDVPGHDDFLPNMLCGVGVVDQILFVVAADDGWSAQSQEHLEILDLLGRWCVAAVVTKADLAGPDRAAEVAQDVRQRLAETSLDGAPVVTVDALHQQGTEHLRGVIADRLRDRARGAPAPPAATRLWIDRVFTVTGAGTVVTGMLESGRLSVGQDIRIAPQGTTGRIRGLQSLERPVDAADAAMRVAVNLTGISQDDATRGDALVGRHPSGSSAATALDAELTALPHASIGRRGAWHLHVGTAVAGVQVFPLLEDLQPGDRGPVRLELDRPLPVRAGDRFIIRDAGRHRTAGGGTILDPAPAPRQRGTERRLTHALVLEELAATGDPVERARALVDAHGGIRAVEDVAAIVGEHARTTAHQSAGSSHLEQIGDVLVRADRLEPWVAAILASAAGARDEHAVESSRLTGAATAAECPPALAPAVVEHLVRTGALRRFGGRILHPDHEAAYLSARDGRRRSFLDRLGADPLEPPDPAQLAVEVGIPSFEVQHLVDDDAVVACGSLLFLPQAITTAADQLREGPGRDGAAFTASEARQAWDTNRRCAVPLLDHLRATGVTTFDGDHHRIRSGHTGTDAPPG